MLSQDEYVPKESARIEENRYLTRQKIGHPENEITGDTVKNMLGSVNCG